MATVAASAVAGGIENFRRPGGTVLVIKPELHFLGDGKRIVVGGNAEGLTLPMMLAVSLAARQRGCQPNQGKIPSCQD